MNEQLDCGCQRDINTGKISYQPRPCPAHDTRQTSLPIAGKTRVQVERDFQNRLTRSIPNRGREALTLEIQESGRPNPKQRGLF